MQALQSGPASFPVVGDCSSVLSLWCARAWAADERKLWLEVLEAEERERLRSLRANMSALAANEAPTRYHINALLVSALQAQVTLFRMSRVFPDLSFGRRLNRVRALRHEPTVLLAGQLRRCWRELGLTDATLRALLSLAVKAAGTRTASRRELLFSELVPGLRRGVDPNAQRALAAEGAGQWPHNGARWRQDRGKSLVSVWKT